MDIEIFGVPRLTNDQEEVLDALSKLDLDTIAKQQQQQEKDVDTTEQIRRQLQQLEHGHGLISMEAEALDRRLVSYVVQRKIYQRLGELTQLKRLTFGLQTDYLSRVTPARLDTLEFSLVSGLAELGALRCLREVEFFEIDLLMESREVGWVNQTWGLRKVELRELGLRYGGGIGTSVSNKRAGRTTVTAA